MEKEKGGKEVDGDEEGGDRWRRRRLPVCILLLSQPPKEATSSSNHGDILDFGPRSPGLPSISDAPSFPEP